MAVNYSRPTTRREGKFTSRSLWLLGLSAWFEFVEFGELKEEWLEFLVVFFFVEEFLLGAEFGELQLEGIAFGSDGW